MPRVDSISRDLAAWMPRLIAVFRARRRTRGPADRLTPDELRLVAGGVRQLSHGLTRGRRLVGAHYMDDPALLGAYLLYFWPVSYAQGRHALNEVGAKPRSVLDLGSGPGPLSLAAFDAGAIEVMSADRSEPALALAEQLAGAVGQRLQTRRWDPLANDPIPGRNIAWSVISLGHVINELWADAPDRIERRAALSRSLLGSLRKGGSLVIVEPALRTTTRELLALRDVLVGEGHAVRAPCLFRGPCPALEREVDWCHFERAWEPPPALAEIVATSGLHKEALKAAYVVLAPKGEAWPQPPPAREGARLFRVVSEHLEGKGRLRVIGCGPEGRVPLALADDARGEATQAFVDATRGDVLAIEGGEPAGEGPGVRINPGASVTRHLRAGEPIETRGTK